jgi:hypothetical protein
MASYDICAQARRIFAVAFFRMAPGVRIDFGRLRVQAVSAPWLLPLPLREARDEDCMKFMLDKFQKIALAILIEDEHAITNTGRCGECNFFSSKLYPTTTHN